MIGFVTELIPFVRDTSFSRNPSNHVLNGLGENHSLSSNGSGVFLVFHIILENSVCTLDFHSCACLFSTSNSQASLLAASSTSAAFIVNFVAAAAFISAPADSNSDAVLDTIFSHVFFALSDICCFWYSNRSCVLDLSGAEIDPFGVHG